MDLGYVQRIPWLTSTCETNLNNISNCCQTLLSLFGIGLSQHLKETSLFQLPDLPTSVSCLSDFQSKLDSLSLPSNLTSLCFDPLQGSTAQFFVIIYLLLTRFHKSQVQTQLIRIDGNTSHSRDCFYFAVLYAAGIVNEYGPESNSAISCILGLTIASQSKSSKAHSALVFGLTGAGVAVFVSLILSLLSLSLSLLSLTSSASTNTTTTATCPMDLGYIQRIPWLTSTCKPTPTTSPTAAKPYSPSRHRPLPTPQRNLPFPLPDLPTSVSCLSDFQSKLDSLSLPSNLTSLCFDPLQFVITPNICASIESTSDWLNHLGPTTPLNSACRSDLTDLTSCGACVNAASQVFFSLLFF
ncbi:hypothetical protein C3L33_19432, partial [Rhododendron williamsianum]